MSCLLENISAFVAEKPVRIKRLNGERGLVFLRITICIP